MNSAERKGALFTRTQCQFNQDPPVNVTLPRTRVCLCRYSIDRRTDMDRVFNVHAGNGSVFILRELDREEHAWHNISVIATEFSKCSKLQPLFCYKFLYLNSFNVSPKFY